MTIKLFNHKIEELVSSVRGALSMGPFGSNIKSDNFVKEGVPVIRGGNLPFDKRFSIENFVFLTEEKAAELSSSVAVPDDLVFTHRGTLGQVGIIPKGPYPKYIVSQSQMKLTPNPDKVHPLFLYYYFRDIGKSELLKYKSDSGVPAIGSPLTSLRNLSVKIPSLSNQKKISSILSAYDELIENNNRRIQILDEMGQRIYREWFVHFRFPGHENVKMVDSEMGKIPKGWNVKSIADVCEFISRGISPKYGEGTGRKVINQKSNRGLLLDYSLFKELSNDQSVKESLYAHSGDLLINSMGEGTLGRVHYFSGADRYLIVDSLMTICRSNRPAITMLLYFMFGSKYGSKTLQNMKTGSTGQTSLLTSTIRQIKFVYPSISYLTNFYDMNKNSFILINSLREKNQTLGKTRDLLLSRLISGRLDVEDLEMRV